MESIRKVFKKIGKKESRKDKSPNIGAVSPYYNNMDNLTKDVLINIFSFLTPGELAIISRVCKDWKKAADSDLVWKTLCKHEKLLIDEPLNLTDKFKSWKEIYKHYSIQVLQWEWSTADKDPSLDIEDVLSVTRRANGHNPSVLGNKAMTGLGTYYFEVLLTKRGEWLSFGFASKEFGVSSGQHTGKGAGSCAYYSDSSTHAIFTFGLSQITVTTVNEGDTIGCLLNLRHGTADFFVNGNFQQTVTNEKEWGFDPERTSPVTFFPALSIGVNSVLKVVQNPTVPKKPQPKIDVEILG